MLATLPLIALFLLFLLCHRSKRDWRKSYLYSTLILGSSIAISSEILSALNLINFPAILVFWIALDLGLGTYYYYLVKHRSRKIPRFTLPKMTILSWGIFLGISSIVICVGMVAVLAPPNNWDSMTYHMARVMHWMQNGNLAHYPTYYSAQLVHPPLAEIAIMHLQILSGGDRFANLVQWFAMVSCLIGVSLIARQLGAKQTGQWLAAVFCATLPMGILQGSSTQNDYAVALWIVCLISFTLTLVSSTSISTPVILAIGSSLGLALFTKSSAYFLSFPWIVWAVFYLWSAKKWEFARYAISIFAISFLFNVGHYLRNLEVFGSPISAGDHKYANQAEIYSLPTLLSNIIRHLSMHVDIVRYFNLQHWLTPITGKLEKLVYLIHQYVLKLDPSDPRITMPGYTYKVLGLSFNEDVAVNPLHFLIILLAIFIFIFRKNLRKNQITRLYLTSAIGGFIIFCLLLKLQPYSVRHHLPFFVLFSPFVGLVFSHSMKTSLLNLLLSILIVTSLPWLFNNSFRPIVGKNSIFTLPRNDMYFLQREHLKNSYFETANAIAKQNCTSIGLSLGWDKPTSNIWEYPFWPLVSSASPDKKYRFSHIVSPNNFSAMLADKHPYTDFDYCMVVAIRSKGEAPLEYLKVKNKTFTKVLANPPIDILYLDR